MACPREVHLSARTEPPRGRLLTGLRYPPYALALVHTGKAGRVIIVLGSVVVSEGRMPEALALSKEHVARSRAEVGCISHAVHHDSENPNRLVFVEEWQDPSALNAHFQVPASRAFAKALAAMASEPPQMALYEATQVKR